MTPVEAAFAGVGIAAGIGVFVHFFDGPEASGRYLLLATFAGLGWNFLAWLWGVMA